MVINSPFVLMVRFWMFMAQRCGIAQFEGVSNGDY